jgi:hypothetical protein
MIDVLVPFFNECNFFRSALTVKISVEQFFKFSGTHNVMTHKWPYIPKLILKIVKLFSDEDENGQNCDIVLHVDSDFPKRFGEMIFNGFFGNLEKLRNFMVGAPFKSAQLKDLP